MAVCVLAVVLHEILVLQIEFIGPTWLLYAVCVKYG